MLKPDNVFKLFPYRTALVNSKIINMKQLSQYFWLELPHSCASALSLYDISGMKSDTQGISEFESLEFEGKLLRECKKPWIRAETALFDTEVGYHLYKLSFFDSSIDDTVDLYFSYRIQTDNPDKSSYVYMERKK